MNPSPNFPTLNDRERGYPAMPAEADGFPNGWVVRRVPQENNQDKINNLFYSPKLDLKFRTRPEARRFLDCLKKVDGNDEAAAIRLLKQEECCTHALCTNLAMKGGLCRKHGPRCAVEGCDNGIYARRHCKKHQDVTTTPQKTIIGEVAGAELASPEEKSAPKGVHDAKHPKKCDENPTPKSSRKSINGADVTSGNPEEKSSNDISDEVQVADSSNISEENVVTIEQEYDQYGVVDTIRTFEKRSSKNITNKVMDQKNVSESESGGGRVKQEHRHRHHSTIPILHQAESSSPSRGSHIKKFESDSESTTYDDGMMVINNSNNGKQQRRNNPQSSIDVIDLTTDSSSSSVVEAEISKIIREKKRVRLGSISREYEQYYNQKVNFRGKLKKLLKNIPRVVLDGKGYAIWKEGELNDEEMNATTVVTPTTASPRRDERKDIQIVNDQRDSSTASAVCQADGDKHERRGNVQLCHNEGAASVNAQQPKEKISDSSGSEDALSLSGTGNMDQITTTSMDRNDDVEPQHSNNERRVLLPPDMKAQLVSLIPQKCEQNKGVSEGDILSKIKGFVAACQGVATEDVLKDNFPNNELEIELLRGKKRYFLRGDSSSRPVVLSKKAEVEEERQQQHHHVVVVQQEKRSNDATTQGEQHGVEETAEQNPSSNGDTSMVPRLRDEKKAIILSLIPSKREGSEGVTFSYILKKVSSLSRLLRKFRCHGRDIQEIFEDTLHEELEIEEINGTKRYFLRSTVPISDRDRTKCDENNVERNEEPGGVQHASITEEYAKERESSDTIQESSNSDKSCEEKTAEEMTPMEGTDPPVGETTSCASLESDVLVDSGISTGSSQQKKNGDEKHPTKEKLIELTPGQAGETKFPPGCQVVYDYKMETEESCEAHISMGVVHSVKISSKGFIYEIKAITAEKREENDDGNTMMINEHSLAYAPTTLIHFQPNSLQKVQKAGTVLLASRMSDNDNAREFRYSVLTPSDNGEHHVIQHNVIPEQLSFRAISSMSEEVHGPKYPPTSPSTNKEKDTTIEDSSPVSEKAASEEQATNKEEMSAASDISTVEILRKLEGSNAKQRKRLRRRLRSSNVGSINEEQAGKVAKRNKKEVADVNSEASARVEKSKKSKRKRTDEKSHNGNQIISPQTQPKEKRRRLTGKNIAHDQKMLCESRRGEERRAFYRQAEMG